MDLILRFTGGPLDGGEEFIDASYLPDDRHVVWQIESRQQGVYHTWIGAQAALFTGAVPMRYCGLKTIAEAHAEAMR